MPSFEENIVCALGSRTKPNDTERAVPPVVDEVSSWLAVSAARVDETLMPHRARIANEITHLNDRAAADNGPARYAQQLLLARIYALSTCLPEGDSAEGSVIVHEVTRSLERATIASEDRWLPADAYAGMPTDGRAFMSWLKRAARQHHVFKHPYYSEFISRRADAAALRAYVIQESVVDGRFDDLLAMIQIGTGGGAKMEIARNFWDEMGNGNAEEVHTHLFGKIYEVFDIGKQEMEAAMTADDLLAGNLAVLLCRYRTMYAEAVGFLGMTEWLVPERFRHVVHAWERLGLPDVGITYHRLHITIDSQHAAGWFHNVIIPAADSEATRRGVARGAFWRLNSSARHLDERLARALAELDPSVT
jgi:pyrroloquinoline quinone (PQQ) biosynthesis protein C